MPSKKKKAFTKNNSTKFLLIHGHENAQNADGETLKNVLVPVSKNYKPGSSLLVSRIAELVNESNPHSKQDDEPDLENIVGQFDDASEGSEEDDYQNIKKDLQNLQIGDLKKRLANFDVEEEFEDDGDNYSGFSDSDSDFNDTEEDELPSKNRPENLKILDERMKRKLKEYDDDQLGALDDEEIGGYLTGNSERVNYFIEPSTLLKEEEEIELGKYDKSIKEKILRFSEEDQVETYVEVEIKKPLEYDCESIISTYSNKYNHPTIIREEGKIRKIKIPANPYKRGLTKSDLKRLDPESNSDEESDDADDKFSIASTINSRPKGETPEQRRDRKALFKEAKRESRIVKKENKLAFKNEKKFQIAQALNVQNIKGMKLH